MSGRLSVQTKFVCLLLFTLTPTAALGEIRWVVGPAELPAKSPAELAIAFEELAARPDARHVVVQFDEPVAAARRDQLRATGLILQDYLGDNAYFAILDTPRLNAAALAATPSLSRAAAIEQAWKLHPDLNRGLIRDWSIVSRKSIEGAADPDPVVGAYVLFHSDVSLDPDAVQIVVAHGAWVRSRLESINGLVIELPYSQIRPLADEDAVKWIEPPLPRFSELNNDNRLRTGADIVQAAPYGLSGAGVTVMVYDGGQALASHVDFGGRLTVRDTSGLSDHATHVSGTVGGDGSASAGTYRGMAPGVLIESYGFEQEGGLQQGFLYTDPGDLEDDYDEAINSFGADISNNSIGTNVSTNGFPCDWEGNYGATSALIDAIARGSLGAPFRIVWANGNERQSNACSGVEGYPAGYHSTAPPACAKNHITVGAMNSNDDSVTSFTSWGPSDDGRMKPDISAPGCQSSDDFDVTSCSSTGGYTGKCGTSMASPTVCGCAALLLQDFRAHYPGEPDFRNSTLKVLLAHTCVDLENPGPDYKTGYGSMRIEPAINLMRSGNFLEGVVLQDETASLLVVVGPDDTQLKVTLAWDDVPGAPNVSPVLVNDLDLKVFDPATVQYFPWTLDQFNPSANAIQTEPDRKNNIEQVLINAPAPGVYRIEIRGFNVPQGPQSFSIAATPLLVACSSAGVITLDRVKYGCSSSATVRVVDCDLNTDDGVVETLLLSIDSDSEPAGEPILLTETAAETAAFEAVISLSTTDAPGVLLIAEGDAVSTSYTDADDGQGGTNVVVTATASVDCVPPVITNVQVTNLEPHGATVTFMTDEPARGIVHAGAGCGAPTLTVQEAAPNTVHSVNLTGLADNSTYYFSLEALDAADNQAVDDNGGNCYTFDTPDVPDFFSEAFSGDNDLDNRTFFYVPNAGVDQYTGCVEAIAALPVDPAGGTTLSFSPSMDDGFALVSLGGGATVSLYGASYGAFFVGSNGYITFQSGDSDYDETLAEHFEQPRISALYDDLHPGQGGSVSWKQLPDRAVVTWSNVPEYNAGNQNTFQIEMHFDGQIRVSYLNIAAADGIAGLSEGLGIPADFTEFDLSTVGACGPVAPSAAGANVTIAQGDETIITLVATDDGLPDPPAQLSYIITTLPAQPLRDAGNDQPIAAVPHTLVAGGNQVIYAPAPGFFGADGFQFKANDGGTPPDGGDSNVAPVGIVVTPVLALPFFDDFPSTTFDAGKWSVISGATIDGVGLGEPSPPNAARFNGAPSSADDLQTHEIDLSAEASVRLTYQWQRTGGGESPDPGDDLFVEYLDALGQWQVIDQHPGSGADMTTFQPEDAVLPPGALHDAFRLRIRNIASSGVSDDWFVDDLSIAPADSPTAFNQLVSTPQATPVDITLVGTDPNGDPLDFVVTSLPSHGELSDPNAGAILAAPYTLAFGGDAVHYSPVPLAFQGSDGFTFQVSDGVNQSNVAAVSLTIGGLQPIYEFLVDDTSPNWHITGAWSFGQPQGLGGDPSGGVTGNNVYGYNLGGDYDNNIPEHYLVSRVIDCSNLAAVQVRFWRWLGVEEASFDHARFQAGTDDQNWTTIWENPAGPGNTIDDSSWTQVTYDISAIADNQPMLFLRWVMGPTDDTVVYHGWNIDDVQIWAIDETTACATTPGDLDGANGISGNDIQPFVGCLIGDDPGAPGCPCADMNLDGQFTEEDIALFVDCQLGQSCP